ncbi:MAG: LPS export ABC transporter periplasmic protein LptC [Candidatus Omnitrophica bacterium]|nr:LPS export ABC transporter periplasmic protein LptC [Candidatus Omnitrophota bacterium]MBD3269569.1 LPS export ABC transporter periplasmic protein LptC [Candidatus Omnitrophota bacterium]
MILKTVFLCIVILFSGFRDCYTFGQQKIKDFNLSNFNTDGSQKWEMKGEEAVVYDNYIDVEKVRAQYYSSNDTITITSKKARLNKDNMDIHLEGDVYIVNRDGVNLSTPSLDWKRDDNEIRTVERVVTAKDDMKIKARGMSADTEFKNVDYKSEVQAFFPGKKTEEAITITCSGPLEIDYNQGTAVFRENVVVVNEQGKMFSDLATLYFDSEKKEIIKIVAEGNVKIVRDDNVTFSQKAIYQGKEEKIILEGKPKLFYFPEEK